MDGWMEEEEEEFIDKTEIKRREREGEAVATGEGDQRPSPC